MAACTRTTGRACRSRACRTCRSSRRPTEVSLDDLFSDIKRGLFVEGRGVLVDRSAALQLPVRRRGDPRDHQRQARRDGARRGVSVAHAGLLGVVRRPRRPGDLSLWGTSADGKGEPGQTNAVSHGCPPARFRNVTVLNTAARVMLNRDEALKICETVLGAREGGGRRRRRRVAAELGRVARALRRQPHHDQRPRRGSRHHAPRCGSAGGAAPHRQRSGRRRAEAAGGRSGADRPRLAGASRVRADARAARRTRRRAALPTATADVDRRGARQGARTACSAACRSAKVTGAGFHTAARVGHRGRDRQRQPPLLPLERSRPQRDRAQRRRHRIRLLRRRSLRSRALDAQAHRRSGGRQGRAIARSRSRSSRASTPSSSSRRRSSDLLGFLTNSFDARTADEGRSAFSAKDGKTPRRREAVQRADQPLQRSDARRAAGGAEHRRRHSGHAAVADQGRRAREPRVLALLGAGEASASRRRAR